MAKEHSPGSSGGKAVRNREWTAASYDPNNGRAAASSMEEQRSYSFDGEPARPIRQLAETSVKHVVRHGRTSR